LTCRQIQNGGGRHIENHTFRHKLAITAYICTKFDTEAVNEPHSQIFRQNLYRSKIQDGGGCHFEIS